jgi:hypothetical protein
MKTICFMLLACTTLTFAQNFSGRTNEIHISKETLAVNTTLPVVSWVSPRLEYSNSQDGAIHIEAIITSEIALKKVSLIISGSTNAQKDILIDPANQHRASIKQNLKLLDGTNTIEITAETVEGGKISGVRGLLVGKDAIADAVSIDRKDYALLFTTDKYDHWTDLVNPIYDGQTIAKELKDRYGFDVEVVENADQEQVWTKIREYSLRRYKPQDQLLIFFAGHGQFDETFGEGFVVAKNSLMNDQGKTTYISHTRLRSVINNIPCEHILLAMDVCFGGTFDPVIAKSRGASDVAEVSTTDYLVRKLSHKTRRYITSGGKEYVSDGIAGKHSPFAAKIIESLRTNGGDDNILTLSDLVTNVEKLTTQARFGEFGDNEAASDFVFVSKRN